MRFSKSVVFAVSMLLISLGSARAQETDAVVVDEVVAQVNESVITLSQINREKRSTIASIQQQQGKSKAEATAIVDGKFGQLIANLISEELLMQRGKEMGVEKDVEAQINQTFLGQMKQFNLKSLDELYAAMRQQGLDPVKVREDMRKRFTQDIVLRNQVDSVTYWAISDKEIKDYYAKNAAKFKKPEMVTISEIFLSFAGRDKNAVKQKARQIVADLRKGADFVKMAMENSDRPDVVEKKGKVGDFAVPTLDTKFAKPLAKVKVGGYTDPIELDIGMEILRLDARTKGSDEAHFDEGIVRNAILQEKLPNARKEYMEKLVDDAYIKIRESYQAIVMPYLKPEDKKTASVSK